MLHAVVVNMKKPVKPQTVNAADPLKGKNSFPTGDDLPVLLDAWFG